MEFNCEDERNSDKTLSSVLQLTSFFASAPLFILLGYLDITEAAFLYKKMTVPFTFQPSVNSIK